MRKDRWNTFATHCYTSPVSQDQRSAGGVIHSQVKRTKSGWLRRCVQTNGQFTDAGEPESVTDAEGERCFQAAHQQ